MLSLEKVNSIQVPTWSWLKVNNMAIEVPKNISKDYLVEPFLKENKSIKIKVEEVSKTILKRPINSPVNDYVNEFANYKLEIEIPENIKVEEPILLEFLLDEERPIIIDKILINAKVGSMATILLNYKSNYKESFHGSSIEVKLDKNSNLKLIKGQMLEKSKKNIDTIQGLVEEKGNLEIILVELGAKQIASECNIVLEGKESKVNLQGIYVGKENDSLDMNYRLEFKGEKSEGDIDIKGVLLGNSNKKLRSTLDFVKGCRESKGSESETVVVLSEDAINISAPLLLCGEDNVEGLHSTSTGRLDDGKLFYLMSRGLSEKEAKTLIIEATMTPIVDKIPDENLQKDILRIIGGEIHG